MRGKTAIVVTLEPKSTRIKMRRIANLYPFIPLTAALFTAGRRHQLSVVAGSHIFNFPFRTPRWNRLLKR